MPVEKLDENKVYAISGVNYEFLAGTEVELYQNGKLKGGILAQDVLTKIGIYTRKFKKGSRIDFNEKGEVQDIYVVKARQVGNIVVFSISGSLEGNNALRLEDIINKNIYNGYKFIILNVGDVHYVSSSGIRVFIATLRQLRGISGKMVLCNLSNEVVQILDVADLSGLFEVTSSEEEAIRLLSALDTGKNIKKQEK